MVTDLDVVTANVFTVKLTFALPADTVTDTGTVATVLLLLQASLLFLQPVRVHLTSLVPVELTPPITLVGLRLSVLSAGGFTVSFLFIVTPPKLAVIVTDVDADTGLVSQ